MDIAPEKFDEAAHPESTDTVLILLKAILRMFILSSGFPAVMRMAQSLPVTPVPKEVHIATVWDYMIHIRGFFIYSDFQAFLAKRVFFKEPAAYLLPLVSVPSSCHLFYRVHM